MPQSLHHAWWLLLPGFFGLASSLQVLKVTPGKWCGTSNEIKTVINPGDIESVPDQDCQIVVLTNKSDVVPLPFRDSTLPSTTSPITTTTPTTATATTTTTTTAITSTTTTTTTTTSTATTTTTTTTTPAPPSGTWGQGTCQWDNQFDCSQDPHGLAQNGCIDKNQLCDGNRDCSWTDTSKPSWDEDPENCAQKSDDSSSTGTWGQGTCQWDNQFDCTQDPHGLAQNGCIDKNQLCDGNRDCSWSDTSKPSWDEDPDNCAQLNGDSQPQPTPSGTWGQGTCQWDNQFDCTQDPHGLAQNGCIDKNQLCNGNRDCSWSDTSKPSWDEDPDWCAWLEANPGK